MNATMRKRTAHRWRLSAVMIAGVFFALGSFWLLQVMNRGGEDLQADARKNEPDYIIDKFSYVRMTLDGKPKYIISGDKLIHRPVSDISEIVKPAVQALSEDDRSPMTMTAQVALLDNKNNLVHLMNKVDIERPPSAASPRMSLTTDALTVFPDEDRMETNREFDLVVGSNTVSGTGMRANNATGKMDVLSKMQVSFPPRAR
jgi:lipopolysaccharide export system protein LptC